MNKQQILRLTKYKRVLYKLKTMGFEKIFSNNLGDPIGVSSALVRKDFSMMNIPGNKRGGYDIDSLIDHLDRILGKDSNQQAILIGCGKIGTALLEYDGFKKAGIRIVAGFDKNPESIQHDSETPIMPVENVEAYITENKIKVAVLATPDSEAVQLFKRLKEIGIKGFLNFAPVELKCSSICVEGHCPDPCIINNINIGLELEHIFYQINLNEQGREIDAADKASREK